MMIGLPNKITFRCDDPHALASRLVAERVAESIRIAGDVVTVSTTDPSSLYEKLPGWLRTWGLRVLEMRSADESLQSLFNSLMKMHRGEL